MRTGGPEAIFTQLGPISGHKRHTRLLIVSPSGRGKYLHGCCHRDNNQMNVLNV